MSDLNLRTLCCVKICEKAICTITMRLFHSSISIKENERLEKKLLTFMDMIRIFYGTKLVVAVIVLVVEIGAENNLFFAIACKNI